MLNGQLLVVCAGVAVQSIAPTIAAPSAAGVDRQMRLFTGDQLNSCRQQLRSISARTD